MAKQPNQKQKLLVLRDILRFETDEEHPMTLQQLQAALAARGISAERKSLYDDLETLRLYGEDIITRRDKSVRYYCGQRELDLPELRLLVDAVQSSKFITRRKSNELIRKLEGLASRHQAGQLQRQVLVLGQIKHMNESIYYTVDALQAAIAHNHAVSFRYFDWSVKKERQLRHDGKAYHVSPWALTWDDENYYLLAYDHATATMRHYRVDRMLQVEALEEPRRGEADFTALDTALYTRKTFGMFGGQTEAVTLRCADWMAGVIFDRFGQDITLYPDGNSFTVHVPVVVSPLFFAWLAGFGKDVRILAPATVAESYHRYLKDILENT